MRSLVVLGLMGAGKSSVAGALAGATGRVLRDSDVDIAAATGRDAVDIAGRSVADLHRLEAEHLFDALRDPSAVVAAAASVVDRVDCREALVRDADVVWLDVPVETLAARFDSGPHRPVFGADTAAVLRDQYARRAGHFAAVADLRLDATGSMEDIMAAVTAFTDQSTRPQGADA